MSCRLGRDLADENGSRLVVREGQWNAHQCVWAVCGAHSAQTVYAFLARDHPVRQLFDRGQCQPPRRHQVSAASLGGQESFDLGSSLSAVNVSSGRTESGGGLFLAQTPWEAKLCSIGWPDLGPLRRGKGGSLCFWGVSPMSPMAPVLIQPSRPGCSGKRLASDPVLPLLALPTNLHCSPFKSPKICINFDLRNNGTSEMC